MKKTSLLFYTAFVSILFTGCTTFYDCTTMSGDKDTDDANMPFVAQDIKDYEARMKFKKNVSITMSERANRFLNTTAHRRNSSEIILSNEMRKDMLACAESKLIQIVSNLRDFSIVNQETTNVSATGVSTMRIPKSNQPSGPYVFTYNINNIEVKNIKDNLQAVGNIAEIGMELGGVSGRYRNAARKAQNIDWYKIFVSLEVNLTDPSGKNIFAFDGVVSSTENLPSKNPSITSIKDAVENAIVKAMENYVIKFGPPLFVDQTIGNGLFVRLSAGSEYGISKGQKVRFFRSVTQKYPTLSGEPPKYKRHKQLIPVTGEVGARNAPVDSNHAWVYVSGNDEPGKKSVFTWTSAEIIK